MSTNNAGAIARAKRDEHARELRELFTRFLEEAHCWPVADAGKCDRDALQRLVERFFLKETGFKWKGEA